MVNIAYYRPEDWNRFINSIDDKKSMHESWEEWFLSFLKTKNELISMGLLVKEIVIDLDELSEYCKKRGLKNNGEARSKFVSEKH